MKNLDKKARAHALKNAIHYNGKANSGAVISGLFAEGLKREDVKEYAKEINEIVNSVNKLSLEEQEKEYEKLKNTISERETREGLEELPDVPKKGVVMRFRPAPSGPLHIGNMIGAGLPNSLYVKKYGGKFYVIIDDTDPEKVLPESYKNIKRDCDWMLGNVTEYIASSDRMKLYYDYAENLLEKGSAYVCTCSQEKFREFADLKENCPCRNNDLKENIYRWGKMMDKKNGYKEGGAVLRFKSDMQNPNPAMRDFPLARINEHEHPKQKKKYRVWPLMNLVVPVDDMELGMTHIIRGKDHRDNAERQKMIFNVFNRKFPWTFFIGRIKFADLILSKRKLTAMINSGELSGEDDESIPTISSLRKRKYKPETFAKFVEQRGLTEVDKVIDSGEFFRIIEGLNR
jgi:glutamyl-tRNA synthetase